MTTEAATRRLASLMDSGDRSEEDRLLSMARDYGRANKWGAAERTIAQAYRALGAEPPDATGYDWHCGSHPIQIESARQARGLLNDFPARIVRAGELNSD